MKWLLILLGAVGITMPWGRVYMREPWFQDRLTRLHEFVHLRQVQRDGAINFSLRYLWWQLRFGYWRNPYEIEAYRIEDEARARRGIPGKARLWNRL